MRARLKKKKGLGKTRDGKKNVNRNDRRTPNTVLKKN